MRLWRHLIGGQRFVIAYLADNLSGVGECSFPLHTAREGAGEGEEKGSKKARSSVETDESLVNYRLQGFFYFRILCKRKQKTTGWGVYQGDIQHNAYHHDLRRMMRKGIKRRGRNSGHAFLCPFSSYAANHDDTHCAEYLLDKLPTRLFFAFSCRES